KLGPAGERERRQNRFEDIGNGVLRDRWTQLEWASRDNGRDISWQAAVSYCQTLALADGGWRLPQIDELADLYFSAFKSEEHELAIHPLFKLTACCAWSANGDGSSALNLNFYNRVRISNGAGNAI